MSDSFKAYKKYFICNIYNKTDCGLANVPTHPIWKNMLMKVSITGVVIGVKNFSERTMFSVDDGTGIIDCSLWFKTSMLKKKISELKERLEFENLSSKTELGSLLSLLSEAEKHELDFEETYGLGDMISIFGNVKIIKNALLIDIQHHNKVIDVNEETLWIFESLL